MLDNFDPLSPDFIAHPVPVYHELLANPPFHCDFGIPTAIVSRHSDAVAVLRDHKRFSSQIGHIPATHNLVTILGSQHFTYEDPPVHTRLRRLVSGSFTPTATAELEPFIRGHIQTLMDEIAQAGRVDFVA